MAKLNGVQVRDMVDGEVTKIAYEGEEYAKVDADFNSHIEGDIVLNLTDREDAPAGDYFIVKSNGSVYDNVNHRHTDIQFDCVTFRKISAETPEGYSDKLGELNGKVSELQYRVYSVEMALEEQAKQAETVEFNAKGISEAVAGATEEEPTV